MTERKWTPGPWEIDHTYQWPGKIRANNGRFVCGCDPHRQDEPFGGIEQNQANACLIAAAPDMADYIQAKADDGDPEAQRIMAKARGEAQ